MFLAERRISLSWTAPGQTRISTWLRSLPGAESESLRSLAIGSDEWLQNSIVLRSWFLAGPFTDKVPAATHLQQKSFLTPPSLGLATRIHVLEQHGKRAKG